MLRSLLLVLTSLCVAFAAVPAARAVPVDAPPVAAASQNPKPHVIITNCSSGCLKVKPRSWDPNRYPSVGALTLKMSRIKWKSWGKKSASATARVEACAGPIPCRRVTATMRFKVYDPGWVLDAYVFQCIRFTAGKIRELKGTKTGIIGHVSETDDVNPRCIADHFD